MAARIKTVGQYLKELRASKAEKPRQVKDALELYIDLWEKTIEKGVVAVEDDIEEALAKIDGAGGLYTVAEE